MKKTTRLLVSLMLVVLIVSILAVPAMAAVSPSSKSDSGKYNGVKYTCTVSATSTTAAATMSYSSTDRIMAMVAADLKYLLGGQEHTNVDMVNGITSITASVDNLFTANGILLAGEIQFVSGDFHVLATRVSYMILS